MKLIVTQPFGGYAKGAEITDAAAVAAALASNPSSVVKVATADRPAGVSTPATATAKS